MPEKPVVVIIGGVSMLDHAVTSSLRYRIQLELPWHVVWIKALTLK